MELKEYLNSKRPKWFAPSAVFKNTAAGSVSAYSEDVPSYYKAVGPNWGYYHAFDDRRVVGVCIYDPELLTNHDTKQ